MYTCTLSWTEGEQGSELFKRGRGTKEVFFFRGGEIHLSFLVKCPFKDFYIYILKIYILHTLNSNVARRSNSKRYFNSKTDKAFCYNMYIGVLYIERHKGHKSNLGFSLWKTKLLDHLQLNLFYCHWPMRTSNLVLKKISEISLYSLILWCKYWL